MSPTVASFNPGVVRPKRIRTSKPSSQNLEQDFAHFCERTQEKESSKDKEQPEGGVLTISGIVREGSAQRRHYKGVALTQ